MALPRIEDVDSLSPARVAALLAEISGGRAASRAIPFADDTPQQAKAKARIAANSKSLVDTDPEGRSQTGAGRNFPALDARSAVGRTGQRIVGSMLGGVYNAVRGLQNVEDRMYGSAPRESTPDEQAFEGAVAGLHEVAPYAAGVGQYGPLAVIPGGGSRLALAAMEALGGAALSNPGDRVAGAVMTPILGAGARGVASGVRRAGSALAQHIARDIGESGYGAAARVPLDWLERKFPYAAEPPPMPPTPSYASPIGPSPAPPTPPRFPRQLSGRTAPKGAPAKGAAKDATKLVPAYEPPKSVGVGARIDPLRESE